MDWICGIQNAINYIENHLTDEIDYEEVAKQSFSSGYHFQRIFGILCGYTLGEYIRLRRLSLAGAELANEKAKVIDVAMKYGYDSPDSFAKAFQKFHGITPSEARRNGQMLKSFSRLSIQIILKGGISGGVLPRRIALRSCRLLSPAATVAKMLRTAIRNPTPMRSLTLPQNGFLRNTAMLLRNLRKVRTINCHSRSHIFANITLVIFFLAIT